MFGMPHGCWKILFTPFVLCVRPLVGVRPRLMATVCWNEGREAQADGVAAGRSLHLRAMQGRGLLLEHLNLRSSSALPAGRGKEPAE